MIPNFNIEQHYNDLLAVRDEIAVLKKREGSLKKDITENYGQMIEMSLASKDEPFGKVRIQDGGYELHYTVPKKVEWDQKRLAEIREKIAEYENPDVYITTKYSVSEASFKSWPKEVQDTFIDARTVKPGSSNFVIINQEEV